VAFEAGRCELRLPHESETLARRPLVAEGQFEVVIDFFEDDLVAARVFVQIAFDGIDPRVLF
jgi:hypothetical protein